MRRVFIPIRQMYYFKEKNMKRINSLLYMGLMGIVLLSSCDAQLDQVNPNAATEETFWQNIINSCQLWKKRKNEIKY